jgi:hypothetical protein
MADRILTWFVDRFNGNPTTMPPAYYMDAEFVPVAVRIYAEHGPSLDDATFEIYDDGVSIMNDRTYLEATYVANTATYQGDYTFMLGKGETVDEMAEDFKTSVIEQGSWLTCAMKSTGADEKNITVQLELNRVSESEEEED